MKAYYNSNNITIYNEDNLEVLRNLKSNSINLIYCDVLYNTGKKFDDYNDDLGSPEEAMEWYKPRFIEMRRVLKSNGSIWIHCNWRLDSYIRILMDRIFGGNCFRNRIYRQHSKERGFYSNFDSLVDCILYYVKNPNDFVYHEIRSSEARIVPLFENGFLKGRSEDRIFEGKIIDLKSKNKHWLISQRDFQNMVDMKEVQLINELPYRFSTVVPIGNLWNSSDMFDTYDRTNIAEAYDTPKPEAVLERIIETCSDPGDYVADFFLGGGTTAVVTKKKKRKGIFCDISKKACDTTIKKLMTL